jgi:hypothetical protein
LSAYFKGFEQQIEKQIALDEREKNEAILGFPPFLSDFEQFL